jgi:hypothetical protein
MGQQGGMINTYGVVYRKRWGVKEEHRVALADWIKLQPIRCTARLGELEEDTESTDLDRDITEWVFQVENLPKEVRKATKAYKSKGRKKLSAVKLRASQGATESETQLFSRRR